LIAFIPSVNPLKGAAEGIHTRAGAFTLTFGKEATAKGLLLGEKC